MSKDKTEKKDKKKEKKKDRDTEMKKEVILSEEMKQEDVQKENAHIQDLPAEVNVVEVKVPDEAQEPSQKVSSADEKIQNLEKELEQVKLEMRKLKNQSSNAKKWFYKEFLQSPVLGEITNLYIENEGKENLYDEIKAYVSAHASEQEKLEVELLSDKEQYNGENLSSLATASCILSIAGLIYAAAGAGTEMGVLLLLFVVLVLISIYVWACSARNSRCRKMIEYILNTIRLLKK